MRMRQFIMRYPAASAASAIGLSAPMLAIASFGFSDQHRESMPKKYPLPPSRIQGLDKYGD